MLEQLGHTSKPTYLLMDRAYEGDETRQLALDLGFIPVVPPKSNRVEPWEYNRELYKRRNEAGTATAAALVLFVAFQMNIVSPSLFEEIDNPLDDTSSFSFRSDSQNMTLVWIANPFVDAEENTDAAEEIK